MFYIQLRLLYGNASVVRTQCSGLVGALENYIKTIIEDCPETMTIILFWRTIIISSAKPLHPLHLFRTCLDEIVETT